MINMATWTDSTGVSIFCRRERMELVTGCGRLVVVGVGGEDCSGSHLSEGVWLPGDNCRRWVV